MNKDVLDLSEDTFPETKYSTVMVDGVEYIQLEEGCDEDYIPFRIVECSVTEDDLLSLQLERLDRLPVTDIMYQYAARIVINVITESQED